MQTRWEHKTDTGNALNRFERFIICIIILHTKYITPQTVSAALSFPFNFNIIVVIV